MAAPAPRRWTDAAPSDWSLAGLFGRLVEISGGGDSAALTCAMGLVRQAQLVGEAVAWVTPRDETFYPPDAAAGGVDVEALTVVRVPDAAGLARAADCLARSGGFGLIALDAGVARLPLAALPRLQRLAVEHESIVLFVTASREHAASVGPLVSLRAHARRKRQDWDRFGCALEVLKDKRRAPGWTHEEVCGGPPGLH